MRVRCSYSERRDLKERLMRPKDARRTLRSLWQSVEVKSCSDGTMKIVPKWRKGWRKPGLMTRSYAAAMVESVIKLPDGRDD